MATRYYSYDTLAEREPVERWEKEGGRLGQKQDYFLAAIGDDYRRQIEDIHIRKIGKPNDMSLDSHNLPLTTNIQLDRTGRSSRASFQSDVYASSNSSG